MKQKLLLSVFMMLLSAAVFAQGRSVSGKVTSAEDGSALPGVTVQVKGTNTGTQTDFEGNFKINVTGDNATLVFRFVGLKTLEQAVGNQSIVNVAMQSDDKVLSEVVVTGYSTMEKREITGAISSIKGDVIQNLPLQSFDRALQGRTSGVLVQSANGVPGGAVRVRIRGVGSISAGNEPLYIVDGVQLNNADNASFNSTNPLAFLNPNDIESIEILKDAAAASIYGAQAANGVVLVTTKKGKAGSKTNFTANYYRGVVEPIRYLDVMNTQQWLQARIEAVQNRNPTATALAVRNSVLGSVRLPTSLSDADLAALPTYDWQRAAYKTGAVDNFELAASGGNDKTTFYISGSYNQQDANVVNIDFTRLTGRLSVSHKVNSKLSFEQSINLSHIQQNGPFGNPAGGSFLGSPTFSSPLILPLNRIRNEDGSFFGTPSQGGIPGILNQNVILVSEVNDIKDKINQMVGNFRANYQIAKGLNFTSFFGLDYRMIRGEFYGDPRSPDYFNRRGLGQSNMDQNVNFTTNHVLNYAKVFNNDHTVSALLGVEYRQEIREGFSASADQFPSPEFRTINTAANPLTVGGFWTGFKRAGLFTNVKYDYKKKYLASLTMRYDGSSRFGEDNRYGFFPGVSFGWAITEEDFLKGVEKVDEIKLRASYGQTGNDQIGNFDSRGLFGAGNNYNGIGGIAPTALNNPTLAWERNETINLGLDYAFFNRRVGGSVEVFQRLSKDLLLNSPVPWTSGFGSITRNVGELRNRGIEFEINTVNVQAGDFSWKTNFNVSFLENKVTKLADGDTVLPGNLSIRVGHPVGTIFTSQYAGVNPATGRPMWLDARGNYTYLPQNPADFRILGANFSDRFGGIANTFSYKGLELSVFFQYELGRYAFNSQNSFLMENGGRLFNGLTEYFDRRWQQPGDITDVPRPIDGNAETRGANHLSGSRTLQDASYWRLKQLTLSYVLPTNIVSKAKLSNVRVYAQAINLLTFTKWEGFDPEFVDLGSGNNGVVPQARNYTFGIQVGF